MRCENCSSVACKDKGDAGLDITLAWFNKLFESIDTLPFDTKRKIVKECSIAHYDMIKMDNILSKYIDDIHGFIRFLEIEWNWSVRIIEEEKIIYADENKPGCVCPVVDLNGIKSTLICYCSEGFAERMFSKILMQDVTAKVISSVLRGDKSCVYEIRWGM